MAAIFLVIPPGFEDLAAAEVQEWFPNLNIIQRLSGGLELQAEPEAIPALNQCLKVPSRILLRLSDFACRDFPKLFKKIQRLDWPSLLGTERRKVEWEVSAHRSRLKIKKRIEETCEAALQRYERDQGLKGEPVGEPVRIYVRFADDICTVSLDTSGEHLHKRGYRKMTAIAPIRENLAAGLILALKGALPDRELADVCLWDPMAGSGTFLLEATLLRQTITSRDFAVTPLSATSPSAANLIHPPVAAGRLFAELRGWDRDPKVIEVARENLRFSAHGDTQIVFEQRDVLDESGEGPDFPKRTWVICNPPYGERLKVPGSLAAFYTNILTRLESLSRPERVGFIIPSTVAESAVRAPSAWKRVSILKFSNGGLPVKFIIWERR